MCVFLFTSTHAKRLESTIAEENNTAYLIGNRMGNNLDSWTQYKVKNNFSQIIFMNLNRLGSKFYNMKVASKEKSQDHPFIIIKAKC